MITDKQFDQILERIAASYPSDVDDIKRYVNGLRKEIDNLELEVDASYGSKKHRRKFDDDDAR